MNRRESDPAFLGDLAEGLAAQVHREHLLTIEHLLLPAQLGAPALRCDQARLDALAYHRPLEFRDGRQDGHQ